MPVVLKPETWPAWLGEQPANATHLKSLLALYPADKMIWRPVSPRVGNVKAQGGKYRVASFTAPGFAAGQPVRVSVLYDTDSTSSDVSSGRLVAAAVLFAFLAIAFAFALLVSRSLQSQSAPTGTGRGEADLD